MKKTMEWINVEDELPIKKSRSYLVYIGGYSDSSDACEIAWFDEDKFSLNQYPELEDGITHWMPLPEPPKQ